MKELWVAPTADVAGDAQLGQGVRVWHLAQVREGAVIGDDCVVGRGAYIDHGVALGARCKVQNYALIYAPARLGDGVFIGPAAVLTNDRHPRAIDIAGGLKSADGWTASGIEVADGASIGAGAILIAGIKIGAWALVAAGAVVARDVPAHAIVAGVPARQIGWAGRFGAPLVREGSSRWRCSETAETYEEVDGDLRGPL